MAEGLGFKTFTTGEVLTSADVNGYLMQGVLVFASEAARDAAITSPQEGQFAFTKDNNSLWYYSGAAWVASGATGDIEGVTAGTGISGGGTSGTVTITNSMATEIDAKGDLVVGTGADTFARLAVGTDGYTLVADSSTGTGLAYAAPATGAGITLISNQSFSAAGTVNVNDVFSATYDNYLILLTGSASANNDINFRFRVAAVDDSSSNYFYQYNDIGGATNSVGRSSSQSAGRVGNCSSGERFASNIIFYRPFAAESKFTDAIVTRSSTGSGIGMGRFLNGFNTGTSFTGFSLLPTSGNITGSVKIYGYKN
jgi:hypothetical protein